MRPHSRFHSPLRLGRRTTTRLVAGLLAVTLLACGALVHGQRVEKGAAGTCVAAGTWLIPATRKALTTPEVINRASRSRIVLLGEHHDRPAHHLWELETISALQGRRQHLVLGLEMFPRSVQGLLDQWVAGKLSEQKFLTEVTKGDTWAFPLELYLPILRFARLNRVPLIALNVSPSLISKVGKKGWKAIPEKDREGISTPAPASPAYEKFLSGIYKQHVKDNKIPDGDKLSGFVAAQLLWDRAFAEGLQKAAIAKPKALVIGIVGEGHLQHGYGVPHQLAALGINRVTTLLPWPTDRKCKDLSPDFAAAVFGMEEIQTTQPARPLLGVFIQATKGGVAVRQVSPDSVAAAAGIHAGDIIVEAAGYKVQKPHELQEIVGRQAPGTWLPLRVRRGGRTLDLVARFPSHP